ncbi:MAG: zinc-finger domain-containing protein [Gammaproteobacteria bacterium]|jgi:uncharacterized Zn-finger protein|nr:zinc-finger domain-containing protein [Gammaproteobacteria bacterium]
MTKQENACAQKTITVQAKDLPLSCPSHNMSTWNAHPKVYLPIEKTGKETCPYCGTHFVLAKKSAK